MASRTVDPDAPLSDPEAIRAAMAKTRTRLARRLKSLKQQLFDIPSPKRGASTVATTKARPKSSSSATERSAKKKITAKKTTPSKTRAHSSRKEHSQRSLGTKAQKVMGKVLTEAAVGAASGAAKAVAETLENSVSKKAKSRTKP